MHEFTDLLPLVEMWNLSEPPPPVGSATDEAMRAVVSDVFTIVDFRAVDVGTGHDFGHFQAAVLRAPR